MVYPMPMLTNPILAARMKLKKTLKGKDIPFDMLHEKSKPPTSGPNVRVNETKLCPSFGGGEKERERERERERELFQSTTLANTYQVH